MLKNEYTTELTGGHLYNGTFWLGETDKIAGCVNDVRIYDNCLSSREIKEISKGLVLHYPLAMPGQENLLSIQISDNHWTNWGTSAWNTNSSREKILGDDGRTWAHIVQNTSDGYGGYACDPAYNSIVIDSSKRYTWSCLAKAGAKENAEIVLWCHWRSTEGGANLSQNTKRFLLTSNPQRISWTLPQYTNATYTVNRINLMMGTYGTGNNEIYFTDVKFEEGEIATPWIPNPADAAYTALGFDDGIEYDVSGYGNNGTVSGVTYSSDSARYSVSTQFDGSDDYIEVTSSALYQVIQGGTVPFTIAFWIYHDDSTRAIAFGDYGLTGGIGFNIELSASHGLRFYWNGNPDWNTSVAVATSGWSHAAFVYDGTDLKCYKDGVLTATKSGTLSTKTKTSGAYRLGRDNRSGTTVLNGKMSDFRIYATALSADDILELYHTSASLADNGTLMAYEFNET